tara:strand:+ start:391 stop:984 length:594 start_codon:yes stop_codon:yes gene_type:complete
MAYNSTSWTTDANTKAGSTGTNTVGGVTLYANFGVYSGTSGMAGALANHHYAVPFITNSQQGIVSMGTDTNPSTSFTIATAADDLTICYWYIMDNITIDKIIWFSGGDNSSGDTTRAHLMSYDIDTDNGSTSGDLSNGVVLADGADITNAGYEQIYYQEMTIQSANVSAGKVVIFTFRGDGVLSDYAINATVKYHLT